MLNEKGQRELAYLVTVDEVREIPNYDRICQYRVGGWWLVSGKGDYQVGDTALYIEIDSLCPYTEQFSFLDEKFDAEGVKVRPDRHKIKTQKFAKGTALSQGLLCPLKDFPQLQGKPVGYFCTEELGITYYEVEDNVRKASNEQLTNMKVEKRLDRWCKKHKILSKFKFIKDWKRKSILNRIKKQQQKKKSDWNIRLKGLVSKTDEERCQNCFPQMKSLGVKWIPTEKIDGTSTTFFLYRGKKEPFTVCSRNVVYDAPEKEDRNFYKDTDGNVYLKMAEKYKIESLFRSILEDNPTFEYICFQGETYGGTIQKRNYGPDHRFALFNLIYQEKGKNQVRLNPLDMLKQMEAWNKLYGTQVECVPLLAKEFELPETCDELLEYAASEKSKIDGGMREGVVFRSVEGRNSFKAVSNEFLLKYHS